MVDETATIIADLSDNALRKLGATVTSAIKGDSMGTSNPTGQAGGRGGGDDEAAQTIQAIKASQALEKAMTDSKKKYESLTKSILESDDSFDSLTDRLTTFDRAWKTKWQSTMDKVSKSAEYETNLRFALGDFLGEQVETTGAMLEIIEKEEKLRKRIIRLEEQGAIVGKDMYDEQKRYTRAMEAATKVADDMASGDTGFAGLMKMLGPVGKTLGALGAAAIGGAKALKDTYKQQLRFGKAMKISEHNAIAMLQGVDPTALAEVMKVSRQVASAYGDQVDMALLATHAQNKYFRFIGDSTEASRFVNESFALLGKSGVRLSEDSLDSLGGTFAYLNKAVGLTSEEFHGVMEGILQETDIRERLRSAQEGEREAIIAGITKQLEYNVAMGMTVEQATEAAKALGRLAGESAKDRFKRAAKVQMAAGAMGIEGGARAAELIRMGQRIDAAGQAELTGIMSKMANEVSASKRGSVGAEIMVDTLLDKGGLTQEFGKDSPFSTTMTSALKPSETELARIREAVEKGPDGYEIGLKEFERVANMAANLQMVAAAESTEEGRDITRAGAALADSPVMGTIGVVMENHEAMITKLNDGIFYMTDGSMSKDFAAAVAGATKELDEKTASAGEATANGIADLVAWLKGEPTPKKAVKQGQDVATTDK